MMWWYLIDCPSDSTLVVFFICNTLNLIGGILLLVAIYQSERKARKEKKRVDNK